MSARLGIGVAAAIMVMVWAGYSSSEPFFVEMRDGTFKRCGNLDYKKERGEWRVRGCDALARILTSAPTPKPSPSYSPPTVSPRPTEADLCPGGCIVWNPATDRTSCVRPCPK